MDPTNSQTPAPAAPQTPLTQPSAPFSALPGEPQASQPPPPPGLPTQMPASPDVTQAKGSSKTMMMVFIIVLVVLILAVGGYYYYITMQKSSSGTADPQTANTAATTNEFEGLEDEVKNIEVTDPAEDLTEVNKEIELLGTTATPSASPTR